MGNLSKNLSAIELACNCGCGQCIINKTIIEYAQLVYDECARQAGTDVTVIVTSGNRCENWNTLEGGKPNSKHRTGKAIDSLVKGFTDKQLIAIANKVLPKGKFYAYSPAKGVMHLQLFD
jgi:uncharacterized protein YcbK (DUF882 family)